MTRQHYLHTSFFQYLAFLLQSPGLSDQTADNSCHDDASSTGAKDDEEDDDEEDDKLDGLTGGDPEKLKAFNVNITYFNLCQYLDIFAMINLGQSCQSCNINQSCQSHQSRQSHQIRWIN